MAALRQLLNTRDMQGALYPRALPEESRQMVKAKMEAMGYPLSPQPPAVPAKEQPSKNNDYDTTLSLKPVRYQEITQPNYEADANNYDRSTYTSVYEQRLSQDLSAAFTNHLAHRPRYASHNLDTNISSKIYEHRRRSRSVVGDAYDSNAWSDNNKSGQARRPPREDSRSASQPPRHYREGSEPIPERHEYRTSPEMINGAFQPLAEIGHSTKKQQQQRKNTNHSNSSNTLPPNKHTNPASTDPSPTNSIRENVKHTPPPVAPLDVNRKRPRALDDINDLDYPPSELAQKPYSDLASEPFDHHPPSFFTATALHNPQIKRLPSTTLPLPSRLQAVFDTPSPDRGNLATALFATLPMEQYEECGDLLLGQFSDVMVRLKQARQVKRKACRAMEEEVARREGWVRRKRGCVEAGLGRLKVGGMSVVRPWDGKG